MEFITSNITLIIFFWLIGAIFTSLFARARNENILLWLLVGFALGWFGIILLMFFSRKRSKQFEVPVKDSVEKKLWYNKIKQEADSSKKNN